MQVQIDKSSGLESVFKKLRFRGRLVWVVGLSVEIKLRFQISLALYAWGLKKVTS